MKKLLLLLLLPMGLQAQSVSVDPYSFQAWGELKASTMISVEYKVAGLSHAGLHYIKVHRTQYSPLTEASTPPSVLGLSVTTPRIIDILRGGIIYFTRNFPTPTDTKLNAFLEASYEVIEHLRIHYRHFSNIGIGDTNHGVDYIGLSYHF